MKSDLQTVRFAYVSPSAAMRAIVRDGQMESGKVWMACRDALHEAIRGRSKWPNRDSLQKLIKGKFGLHSQSAQMVCHAFLANVDTATQLRKSGRSEIRYPYKDKLFYPLLWPAQAMSIDGNKIVLPMGRGRKSIVLDRPDWLAGKAACKLVWNRMGYELHVSVPAKAREPVAGDVHATIDLGQIHQCAVTTNTGQGLIVSGRGIRAEKQRTSKMHGSIAARQARCKKGSKRYRRLQKARNTYAARSERRIRDKRHKGTRQVVDFCEVHGVSQVFIGNPDGVRKRRSGRHHNQRMSQWEYGKDIDYLTHKIELAGMSSFTGSERGTSSRCPACGHRHKPAGREWTCKACGFRGHRDLVGSINMHPIAFGEKPMFPAAYAITYLRPGTAARQVFDRSNRPDPGHGEDERPIAPMSLNERMKSTAGIARVPQGAGHNHSVSSEAHSL
jgi:putative transposase